MALIFDRFETIEGAAAFVSEVKENHGREATIYTDADEAAGAGFFPFVLEGKAVVIVDRETYDGEEEIIALVKSHGGSFAGT